MALSFITPTKRLRSDAAASYKRMRKAGMPGSRLESAWRSWASQQKLRDKWVAYDAYVHGRGPWAPFANFALKPADSKHVKGVAVDSHESQQAWIRANGKPHGWYPVANERWHFEYTPELDLVGIRARKAALKARAIRQVKRVQRVLGNTQDGIPGPKTQWAFQRATARQLRRIQRYILHIRATGTHDPATLESWRTLTHAATN